MLLKKRNLLYTLILLLSGWQTLLLEMGNNSIWFSYFFFGFGVGTWAWVFYSVNIFGHLTNQMYFCESER